MAAPVLWSRASAATSSSADSGQVGSAATDALRLDVNISAITAGSIQFFVEALEPDGIWYALYNGVAISVVQQLSVSIGPHLPDTVAAALVTKPGVPPDTVRVRWVIVTGPITFSAQLVGNVV
jgi:hypothetical protein